MALESKTKTINGHEYRVMLFPARQAIKVKTKLAKLIGGALGNLGSKNTSIQAEAIGALLGKLDENQVLNLIFELLSATTRDSKEITETVFDDVYAGNLKELYEALWFVLEVNYKSFLEGLNFGSLQEKAKRPD